VDVLLRGLPALEALALHSLVLPAGGGQAGARLRLQAAALANISSIAQGTALESLRRLFASAPEQAAVQQAIAPASQLPRLTRSSCPTWS
jgi:hypothetical protein